MLGQIKRVAGGVFIAECDGDEYRLHSPGKIKKQNKLIVGDIVEFEKSDFEYVITQVKERKNSFIRPQAANIDIFLIVASMKDPDFDQYLTDKLTAYALMNNTEPVILITKADLDEERAKLIKKMYDSCGVKTFISRIDHNDYSEITELLKGKLVLAVGNSGVGKSTFLNQFANENIQKTAETSKKLGRGRHTTRHVEIFDLKDFKLIDTPGFASLDIGIPKDGDHIKDYFREFVSLAKDCKFNTCKHINEPSCAVKKALQKGEVYKQRYESYLRLVNEVKELEERRW